MSAVYNVLGQADDDARPKRLPPFSPSLSTTSQATSTTAASPSQSPPAYTALAEQTFTPLSMDSNDYTSDGRAKSRDGRPRTKDGRGGPTLVSAMVQSFEALQASSAARTYELLSTRSAAPSPSPSLSPSPSPAPEAAGREEAGRGLPVGDRVEAVDAGSHPCSKNGAAAQCNCERHAGAVPHSALQDPNRDGVSTSTNASANTSTNAYAVSISASNTTIARPRARSPPAPTAAVISPTTPPIVRTSSTASLALSHPTPDVGKRSQSGAFLGNIAALEATAERLSMTSSIEDSIRHEHNELKRSESQRSSILQASRARGLSTSDAVLSRHSSIVDINTAARHGGYSPGGYIMSPHPSMSTASAGLPPSSDKMPESPHLSRHGPGKASTRSTASQLSLAQIAELEQPTALDKAAFDEADRAAAAGHDGEDEDTILAKAHQFIEDEFADFGDYDGDADGTVTPQNGANHQTEAHTRLQIHQPDDSHDTHQQEQATDDRPMTAASNFTLEQARAAFGDFDGVHCDPEADGFAPPRVAESSPPRPRPASHMPLAPRPTSYFDPATGQEMLYYPAPVPAMLNLPPKLSKKPKATAAREARRSQLLSAMSRPPLPPPARESRVWLPDPTETLGNQRDSLLPEGFMGLDLDSRSGPDASLPPTGMDGESPGLPDTLHARQPSETSTVHAQQPPALAGHEGELRRPQRLTRGADRKSRAPALDGLPSHLRASVFFDLPSASPQIEIKDGSAMATLDSILDASAHAPVSAFTDHAFAGTLGAEVYGPEKKAKKKKKKAEASPPSDDEEQQPAAPAKPKKLVKRNSAAYLLDPAAGNERAASRFSLASGGGRSGRESDDDDDDDRVRSPNKLAPGSDEESSGEEEESDPDVQPNLYQGPPTTLLAELQLRKQRNKLRTQPVASAYPNGIHSTLLELDAVAEVERQARRGKRVNLAWEDPNAHRNEDDSEDEEVPLGMLLVSKATGQRKSTMDISAVMNEVHRPLGLMERREMEDNEPLSRRRERLRGGGGGDGGLVPASLDMMQKRMSHMSLAPLATPAGLGLRSQSRLTLPLQPSPLHGAGSRAGSVAGGPEQQQVDSEPEMEGETLAQRKARLAAENPLPRPRPVSGAFSSELLSQFGPDPEEEDTKTKDNDKGKETAVPLDADVPEEEETLGQRRRRLQAEREARDREMAAGGGAPTPLVRASTMTMTMQTTHPHPSQIARPATQMSMADVLNVHPRHSALGPIDPREQERMRREAEALKAQQEHEAKMAMMRAQMPTSLTAPSVGARNGGYMNGRFNDGLGGVGLTGGLGFGGSRVSLAPQQAYRAPGVGMGMGMAPASNMMGMAPVGTAPYVGGYGMPMVQPQAHIDMVERWRQGVMP